MRMTTTSVLVALALAAPALAEEKAEAPARTVTPLKVQVVFARYQGDKKISSMPYTLSVNADDRTQPRASVRMGVMVPITTRVEGAATTVYKDVGSGLDCTAEAMGDGRYKLVLSLEQQGLGSLPPGATPAGDSGAYYAPVLRNFRSQTNLYLRDGQTAQYSAATDPVTGEVLKIDVTLNVVK